MQVSRTVATAFAALLVSTLTLACKCLVGDYNDYQELVRTQSCCCWVDGTFLNSDNCLASSISNLYNFRVCCGGKSDCDYQPDADGGADDYSKAAI
ncbi:hypothetical protein CHU98_g10002 [Xylaria longipes]|nr:hypothetical protein CHU98_g10002 [Xylaria longipes]